MLHLFRRRGPMRHNEADHSACEVCSTAATNSMFGLNKKREIFMGKCYKHGASFGEILSPDIRALTGVPPGDYLLMNLDHGILWMVKAYKSVGYDRNKVSAIFDKLFPDKVDADGSK